MKIYFIALAFLLCVGFVSAIEFMGSGNTSRYYPEDAQRDTDLRANMSKQTEAQESNKEIDYTLLLIILAPLIGLFIILITIARHYGVGPMSGANAP